MVEEAVVAAAGPEAVANTEAEEGTAGAAVDDLDGRLAALAVSLPGTTTSKPMAAVRQRQSSSSAMTFLLRISRRFSRVYHRSGIYGRPRVLGPRRRNHLKQDSNLRPASHRKRRRYRQLRWPRNLRQKKLLQRQLKRNPSHPLLLQLYHLLHRSSRHRRNRLFLQHRKRRLQPLDQPLLGTSGRRRAPLT